MYLDHYTCNSIEKHHRKHLEHLHKVFARFGDNGLKLKLFKMSIRYLGHVVLAEGITTDPAKTVLVKDSPIPKCKRE